MTRRFPLLKHGVLAIATSLGLLLAFSPLAYAQHSRGGGGSSGGGHATAGGGQSSGGDHSGGSGSGDGGHSGGAQSAGGGRSAPSGQTSGHAVTRGTTPSSGSGGAGSTASGATTRDASGAGSIAEGSSGRTRDGRSQVGRAVARPPYAGGGTTVIVSGGGYGGYYPWGYGGLGFGAYYGFYDPWWDDPYPPVYVGGGYGYDGALRLKVKPREASVYVDGYFAGHVDDFDGVFQRLKIESGPHHVEIRLDGYETLTFDVRITAERTITYTGELKKVP